MVYLTFTKVFLLVKLNNDHPVYFQNYYKINDILKILQQQQQQKQIVKYRMRVYTSQQHLGNFQT